jgi:PAS domain S-box-containing protein
MDWLIPDITIILATLCIIFLIFLRVGTYLKVRETFFSLWILAWLLSIFHYVGQMAQANAGRTPMWGGLVNVTFLAYSAIVFIGAAESLRGRKLRQMIPIGAGAAILFTVWGWAAHYSVAPKITSYLPINVGLGILFGLAGVSHWRHMRKHYTIGASLLAYSFMCWALIFFVFAILKGTGVMASYIQYMYQFSNLPKPVAAISMLIFLLEAERASAARQRDFSDNVIDHAPDGLFILDLDSNITRANRRFLEICGRPAHELMGKPLCTVAPPSEAPVWNEKLSQVFEGGTVSCGSRIERDPGDVRDVIITSNPIRNEEKTVGAMGIVRDVTEWSQLEHKLRQAEKMASIGLLVSGVAHELNNPLTSVLGFTELALADPAISETMSSRLTMVLSEAKRTRNMIQKLLKAVRHQESDRIPVRIDQVVRDTVALREYDFALNNIAIALDLCPGLPCVLADPSDIQQVLINLLQNAFDAIIESGCGRQVKVRTYFENGSVAVDVVDDGPGISEPAKVFDMFYTTKPTGKGTGLGLSICYQIIKGCGGEISVTNLSPGARFTFKVPPTGLKLTVPVSPERAVPVDAKGRVLIVDDEPSILELARLILVTMGGLTIEVASSGAEAIEKLSRSSFDAVVTDYRMPGKIDGSDLYDWICDHQPGLERRVIFMTGDAVNVETHRFLQTSESPVLFKPFQAEELLSVVNRALAKPINSMPVDQSRRQAV